MRRFIAAFARNTVFANILLIGFIFSGVVASIFMVRELMPEFSVDVITVTVPYPGADPEEVEEGICQKIEEAIDGLEGVKRYTTQAQENLGAASIEVLESYDTSFVKDEVKNRIDSISSFPVDAEKPVVSEVIMKREVIILALSGPLGERGLKEWAEDIKDELTVLEGVSQVEVAGAREYEIAIEVSEERLREYGLTFSQVAAAVRRSSLNRPGGTLRTEGEEIRLRTIGRKYWGDEFGKIVVVARPQGEIITLDHLAAIKDSFEENRVISRLNGEPCILVIIKKTPEEDAIAISETVRKYVASRQRTLPEGLKMTIWSDSSEHIQARIRLLVRNGLIGLTVVFCLLWMFLDLRLSFWATMGIPISLSGALAIMWLIGATINMVSLFGLIMVLGIIVDDAIVVGEAIYVHRKRGDPPLVAAVDGVVEVGIPVIAAVVTTIIAFVPLMFIGGVLGKFIRILPVAVMSALAISLIEALIMLPAHLSHLPDPNDPGRLERLRRNPFRRFRQGTSDGLEWFIQHLYMPFVAWVLRWRYAALCVAISVMLVTLGLVQGGFLKYVMFPRIDGDDLTATVEFPNGTPIEATLAAVERIEEAVRRVGARTTTKTGETLIENIYSIAGSGLGRRPGRGMSSTTHIGAVRIEMLKSERRGIHSRRIQQEWEDEIGAIPGVVSLTVSPQQRGPGSRPIEIWVRGKEMDQILAAADDVIARLCEFQGVSQVESDFRPGKNEIRYTLKPEARAMGLTVNDLGRQVYAGFFGEEAVRLQRGRDDIRVRVRYPSEERRQLSDLAQVRIRTPRGDEAPLSSVADVSYGPGFATITRTDGMRRVSVSADVDDLTGAANAKEIIDTLEAGFFTELKARHPGISLSIEGEKRDSAESMGTLFIGFPLALIGIFVVIATIFRSYAQPVVIMLTVPFGIVGACFGHLAMGFPITLISVAGMVALSGVVVNDAIVLIECINTLVAKGVPFFEALQRGGARRFRAIFLTSLSTIGGLTPMILETDRQAQFLIPMALALASGVGFATLLTLLLEPCLLAILNDLRRAVSRLRTGKWPSPEEVEPARDRYVDLLNPTPPKAEADVLSEPVAK